MTSPRRPGRFPQASVYHTLPGRACPAPTVQQKKDIRPFTSGCPFYCLKASLFTFFSKKVREKGVCGKVQSPSGLAGSAREKPPLTGEVAERSDGRRGFLPLPVNASLPGKHQAGHARPIQRSKMKARSHHRRGRRPRRPAASRHTPSPGNQHPAPTKGALSCDTSKNCSAC